MSLDRQDSMKQHSQNEIQVRKGKSKTDVFKTGEKNMNLRKNR